MDLPLDPEPWACYQAGATAPWARHAEEHEGYVYFEPRPGYEQDQEKY